MNPLSLLFFLPFTLFNPQIDPAFDFSVPKTGIYLTSQTVGNQNGADNEEKFAKLGGNMIVFDVQDSKGKIAYPTQVSVSQEIGNHKEQIKNLTEQVKDLHDKGFYVVARMVLIKNPFLAAKKPEWTLKKRGTKSPFVSRDGPVWLDPGNPELQQYFLDTAKEIALSGVDEVQFDYIRFPEAGKGGVVGYSFTGEETLSRDQAITNLVKKLADVVHEFNVNVSVDVFGIIVWDNVSWKFIGQNVSELAKYVDVICPMPYPSHFGAGWGGHANPANEPYFFVQETTKKFEEQMAGGMAKQRPWLQGFAMNVTNYNSNYIREQVKALRDIGIGDYTIWNAANNYGISFGGLR